MLPLEKSQVHAELIRTELININFKKTKLILFNPCTSIDFLPSLELGDVAAGFDYLIEPTQP